MASERSELRDPLTSDSISVERLVARVMQGRVRTPEFQRGLVWKSADVLKLFDSVLRGFPIGVLLFQEARATASRVRVGTMHIDAPELEAAWWVVDGQQRITALTVALARHVPLPTQPSPDDEWAVWFDPEENRFRGPGRARVVPSTWVELPRLRDASELQDWLFGWEHAQDAALRKRVLDASTRIREYRIPYYAIATDDLDVLKEIFERVNRSGKPLEWTDVHDALFGRRHRSPSTLDELGDSLETTGFGRPDRHQLLKALLAAEGHDVTRSIEDHFDAHRDTLSDAAARGVAPIRQSFDLLRSNAGIPHLRLLPRFEPLLVLVRFFAKHPNPSARTRELLSRYVWRVLTGGIEIDERTLLRRAIRSIDADESDSAQALLRLAPAASPGVPAAATRFDPRTANSRLDAIALASFRPRDPVTDQPIDVPGLLARHGAGAFVRCFAEHGAPDTIATRAILDPTGSAAEQLLQVARRRGDETTILESHGIDETSAHALREGDLAAFLRSRQARIAERRDRIVRRNAAFGRSDRPSIAQLLNDRGGGG